MWYIGECLAEPEPCHSRAGIRNIVQESITRARLVTLAAHGSKPMRDRRRIDLQDYHHYIEFGSKPNAKANFRQTADRLLSFVK
jgi:hypothetical protein